MAATPLLGGRQWAGGKPQKGEVSSDGQARHRSLEELILEVLGGWARHRGGKIQSKGL